MGIISFNKDIISNEAIISSINQLDIINICAVKSDDKNWLLVFDEKFNDQKEIENIKKIVFFNQETYQVEKLVSPIREILYKKAFSPIEP